MAYQRTIGISAPTDQKGELGALPLHFALRFGWQEVVDAVAKAYSRLPAEDRARVAIVAPSFGEAGAVDLFGPALGLPGAISTHNNYWLWGTRGFTGEVALVIDDSETRVREIFEEVERVADVSCEYCMPSVSRMSVFLCRRSQLPVSELWLRHKNFQ